MQNLISSANENTPRIRRRTDLADATTEMHTMSLPACPQRGPAQAGLSRPLPPSAPGLRASLLLPLAACLLALPPCLFAAATASKTGPVIGKWSRFEQSFRSSVAYANPLQNATLTVVFTSPLGETNRVYGFWDGGKVWRVRFAPDQPGRWTFKTFCSDLANQGLHAQSGEFVCTAASGETRFQQHGPVRAALDHHHLEHADGTPFFWLADTAWNGARMSQPKDWDLYAATRAGQQFTVIQWAVAPGDDAKHESAYAGFPDRIAINPEFFKRLDAKLETLTQAGLLSAIAPLSEVTAFRDTPTGLSDDQTVLLLRYAIARWGAEPVAWLLAFDGGGQGKKLARWKHIGQTVFGQGQHALVVVYPGQAAQALDELRDEKWVDVFAWQSVTDVTEDALKETFAGPFAKEWTRQPARPLIPFAPYENAPAAQAQKRFSADDVRHAVYESVLAVPPAGVSYGAQGVVNWDGAIDPATAAVKGANLPLWQRSMFMPAAKQMKHLANLMNSIEFWRLRPEPKFVATQPGATSPHRYIVADGAEAKDLGLVYVPEDRTLELRLEALPASPSISWLNPRTGENSPAVAVVGGNTCQFPTPDPGDWLLLMKGGK